MNGLENCAGGYLSLGFGVGKVVLCGDRLLERGAVFSWISSISPIQQHNILSQQDGISQNIPLHVADAGIQNRGAGLDSIYTKVSWLDALGEFFKGLYTRQNSRQTFSRGVCRGGWRRSPLCGLLSLPDKIKEKIESKYQKNETNLSFFATFL